MIAALLLVACGSSPTPAPAPSPEHAAKAPAPAGKRSDTDIGGLAEALDAGKLVIDVRTQAEWDAGHVPGAVHIEMPVPPDHEVLQKHDKGEPVFVVCQSGGRSSRVADALAASGFQTVNVSGGTGAWVAAGKPVEK